MNVRLGARVVAFSACLLMLGAGCSSSDDATDSSTAATSTTTASQKANQIPFNVGDRVSLAGHWTMMITKVTRPYTDPQLPELDAGREYTALDITMQNRGTTAQTVDAAEMFTLGDSTGQIDEVVAVSGGSKGLDGDYPPETFRSGRLAFDVPVDAQLRMAFDGTSIGSQHAIFMVDPPSVGPGD